LAKVEVQRRVRAPAGLKKAPTSLNFLAHPDSKFRRIHAGRGSNSWLAQRPFFHCGLQSASVLGVPKFCRTLSSLTRSDGRGDHFSAVANKKTRAKPQRSAPNKRLFDHQSPQITFQQLHLLLCGIQAFRRRKICVARTNLLLFCSGEYVLLALVMHGTPRCKILPLRDRNVLFESFAHLDGA
jgi:hypothetical protein